MINERTTAEKDREPDTNDAGDPETPLYVQTDLEDYADFDAINISRMWRTPSRANLLKQALSLNDEELTTIRSGEYDGQLLFVFQKGGYLWLVKDSYGSCEKCDEFIAADQRIVYLIEMVSNGYAFESNDDAVRFLREKTTGDDDATCSYRWLPVVNEGIEAIDNLAGGNR